MKINHVTILVADRLKSAEFYNQVLGLPIIEKGKSRWIKVDNQYIHLAQDSGLPTRNFTHFCLLVDNLPSFLKELIQKGIEVFDLDKDIQKVDINSNFDRRPRQFFINDPDGNLIELADSGDEYFR